eukprot:3456362-Rhodomonas_salina.2
MSKHLVEPSAASAYVFSGHAVQVPEPLLALKVPLAQGAQSSKESDPDVVTKYPAGHTSQLVCPS